MSPAPDPSPREPTPGRSSVWGRVVDALGGPLPTAEVFWVDGAHAGEETVGLFDVHKIAHADAEGRFWAPALPDGPCLLVPDFERIGVTGDRVRITYGTQMTLPRGDGELTLVFPRRRTEFAHIAGVVTTDPDGRPVSRLPVTLVAEADLMRPVRSCETRTNGSFEFGFLEPGRYHLLVWGTPTHVGGDAPVEALAGRRVDCTLPLLPRPPGPRWTIRVQVTEMLGTPIAGARVNVILANVHVPPKSAGRDGRVEVRGLPVRPDTVFAAAHGFWTSGAMDSESDAAGSADAAEAIEVGIVLEPAARLRIAARDAATGRPLRHANFLVSHGGLDRCIWGGVLPPPEAAPVDHHDVNVPRQVVTVRAENPGYRGAERQVDATDAVGPLPITLDLVPRSPS